MLLILLNGGILMIMKILEMRLEIYDLVLVLTELILLGPKQPGNDIDIYLAPLIDDLKTLWSPGVQVYDSYKRENFNLRAIIFCTINDFPAYGNLSRYSTKGYKACPLCEDETSSIWLTNCKKPAYMGIVKDFLRITHTVEKKSCLMVRHCIDVMHIEKKIKTKDGINVRKDFEEMKIRTELQPDYRGKKTFLPPACYTLSKTEKTKFCQTLHGIKVPSGYSANIKRLVSLKDNRLLGMKSHDCHVLMTQMILIAIRDILPNGVRHTITKLCLFFNMIHSKVIDPEVLDTYQKDIIITLCQLEMYFPPSFFDIMVHLVSHIIYEIKACGPVFLRYMYPFERYMGFLKGYVRNYSRPEGSIIEGYLSEEVSTFCTDYLTGARNIGLPQSRHEGRLQGVGTISKKVVVVEEDEIHQAHFTVLQHMTCIDPYIHEHMNQLKTKSRGRNEKRLLVEHNKNFSSWLKKRVNDIDVEDQLVKNLGPGPDILVTKYQGYDINGYTFYTHRQDEKSTMQNSGVTLIATSTELHENNHDVRATIAKNSYYGVIQEIWELDYHTVTIPLFNCKWVENKHGVQVDSNGFTIVNLSTNGYSSEPFILAKQATQVFFVQDPKNSKWHIVLHGKRRILGVENVVDEDEYDQFDELPPFSIGVEPINDVIDHTMYLITDHSEGLWIDTPRSK
ncbi:uncharacterized protein [Rutidosis leptorrhynchoides]|uniref:uncharacterized protein n=1 Tax=Rutidosis leptorrhynchoides TaxID=125765 RepID=UPI003A99ABC2